MAVAAQHAAQSLFGPVLGQGGQLPQALLEPALLGRAQQRVAPVAHNRRVQHVSACLAQLVLPPCTCGLLLMLQQIPRTQACCVASPCANHKQPKMQIYSERIRAGLTCNRLQGQKGKLLLAAG